MRPLFSVLAVLAFALTGCSAETAQSAGTPPSAVATPSATSPAPCDMSAPVVPTSVGVPEATGSPEPDPTTFPLDQDYYLETPRGAKMFLRTPMSPVSEVEALRTELKIKPVSYLIARIDNGLGGGEVSLESVTLYDAVGNTYKFTPVATDHITEWGPFMTEGGPVFRDRTTLNADRYPTLQARISDLQSTLGGNIEQGARGDAWLLSKSTNLPREVTRVTVKVRGTPNPVHAYPGGVQGYCTGP